MVYDDPGEFESRVLEFLTDGLAQGHRVCYAANRDTAVLWDDLRDLDETKWSRRPGAVQVQSFDDATGAVVEPIGLVQAYMTSQPFSALCAYNRGELGGETIAQIACLHPVASDGSAPFRLHASTRAAAFLGGELDLTSLHLFPLTLQRTALQPAAGEIVIDASSLCFIDHRSMLALADYARSLDTTVVLRTDLSGPARIIEILDLPDMRVEPSV